jgi:L-cysteine:1D-myo-inositol 2-amino-2-deoxy-alpha-D-glucopyranoside ligase
VRVHDTPVDQAVPTGPGPTARLYVCGITPYDATHLGHAATYVAFDLLLRAWRDAGHSTRYVQNVTDIDDPLLERAVATGQDWRALADRETELFRQDMEALRVLPPDHYVGAVESMALVVDVVQRLQDRGLVYTVDEDLYFDVTAEPTFGSVARWSADTMTAVFAERGGDPARPGKRHPLDPLLWQAARPDEPAWDSQLGHGRPGWHVECTAIAHDRLGPTFDVQGGGRDLVFPHHEMCAAIGHALSPGLPFARHYVHAGMVGLDGEKMSKSRGNLVLVSRLRAEGHDPMAIRLALLAHHYRGDWTWTPDDLVHARARWERWTAASRLPQGPTALPVLTGLREALADDLDAPRALAVVDRWCEQALAGRGEDEAAPGLVADAVDALLGIATPDRGAAPTG